MFAYLDAGSGSMIAGVVATGAAGVGVMAKSWMGKLKGKKKDDVVDEAPAEEPTDAADADS